MMKSSQRIRVEDAKGSEATPRLLIPLLGSLLLLPLSYAAQSAGNLLMEFSGGSIRSLCPFLNITGLPCPFCGLTRSLLSLTHGDIFQAFWYHPLGPVLWGSGTILILCQLGLALMGRKVSIAFSKRVGMVSLAAFFLIMWVGNIVFGHQY